MTFFKVQYDTGRGHIWNIFSPFAIPLIFWELKFLCCLIKEESAGLQRFFEIFWSKTLEWRKIEQFREIQRVKFGKIDTRKNLDNSITKEIGSYS